MPKRKLASGADAHDFTPADRSKGGKARAEKLRAEKIGFAEVTPDGAASVDDSDVGDILEREAVFGWGWTVKVDCHGCGLERLALPFRFS